MNSINSNEKQKTVSLVVPAFNEEDNIIPFTKRVGEVFESTDYITECIFVDDGSKDKTYERLKTIIGEYEGLVLKAIRLSRNFGKESAILAGLEHSSGDFVTIIDADLQQDPKYALEMVEFLESNPDYDAVACYQEKRKEGRIQQLLKKGFYSMANRISEVGFEENASDFRTLRRRVVEAVLSLPEYNRFSKGIFAWVGFETHYMPYVVNERIHGETKWSVGKLFRYAIDGFVGFSSSPLRVASWCGAVLAALSFLYFIFVAAKRIIYGIEIPGYATIVCLLLIIGGMQMIFIGIIGEYIARMFMEVKNRPNYIVKELDGNTDVTEDGTR